MSPEFVNMKESVICAAKYFLVIISTLEAQKFTGKVCNAVLTHKNWASKTNLLYGAVLTHKNVYFTHKS